MRAHLQTRTSIFWWENISPQCWHGLARFTQLDNKWCDADLRRIGRLEQRFGQGTRLNGQTSR